MLRLIRHLSAPLYGLSNYSHTRDRLVAPVDTVLIDKRDKLLQGVAAEQMVLIGAVGTGVRALEQVWSARSICVVVVAEIPQEQLAPPSSCCHWAPPQTTVSVLLSFSTGAGAGLERSSLTWSSRCLLGNNRCLLLFCLVDGHCHCVCLVVVDRRGCSHRFHVGDLVVVVARRPLLDSLPWRRNVGGVIVARQPLLRRRLTRSKDRGECRSHVFVV